jgi:hypothetical protein
VAHLGWKLQQGYYVVSADHEGPDTAFIAEHQEASAILDALRALRNFKNLPSNSASACTATAVAGTLPARWST